MSTPLPTSIRVGPYAYAVYEYPAHDRDAWGRISFRGHRIGVGVGDEVSDGARRTSLLHEVAHAIHELAGINESDVGWPKTEERYIGATAALWLMVLRDNPDLVAYLTATDG